ncbi:MAG: FadR/GntR family transcriptional regulator [Thermodesulfobacteriota bacterium]
MFKSVRTDRMSQAIVDQIKEAIFQKKIKIGEKLPPERQLIEQFQTSRVTVREALKNLENSGIVEIRRGTLGGAFVRNPDVKFVSGFLQDMFSMGRISVRDLTEARMAVEPYAVKMAAERIGDDSLIQIRQNIDETGDCLKGRHTADARLLTLEYHRLIAQASGNPVIFFMVDSIMDIMENNVPTIGIPAESIENTLHHHEAIFGALVKRDPDRAQALMLRHIQEIHAALDAGMNGMKNRKKTSGQQST